MERHNRTLSTRFSAFVISVLFLIALGLSFGLLFPDYLFKQARNTTEKEPRVAYAFTPPQSENRVPNLPGQRSLYPYSVIAGGVVSAAELTKAIANDPVVAQHYSGFSAVGAHVVNLRQKSSFYVSYRIGEDVFWTKRVIILHKGELLLSDGRYSARARCGNRLSETPQLPVSQQEPMLDAFEKAQPEPPSLPYIANPPPTFFRPSPLLMPIENRFLPRVEPFVPYMPTVGWQPDVPVVSPPQNPLSPPVQPAPPTITAESGTATLLIVGGFGLWALRILIQRSATKKVASSTNCSPR